MPEKFHNDADKTVYTPRHMAADPVEATSSTEEAKPEKASPSKRTPAKSASTKKES